MPGRLRREQRSGRLVGVVRPPEFPAGRAGASGGAVGQVEARLRVLDRRREHRPVGPATRELRGEDLVEVVRRRRPVERRRPPPEALVERRRVHGRRIERVERDVGDAERGRIVAVPDLGERRSAVVRLVQADRVGARLEPRRLAAVPDHVREARARPSAEPDEDVVRVRRVDHDLADRATEEGVLPG